jgi:Transposase, Mutator family
LTKWLVERALRAELARRRRRCRRSRARWRSGRRATPGAALSRSSCARGQRRFQGFDDKILALYARGLSTFLDALVLKIREGGTVQRKACYLALGVTVEGERDVLGLWFQETENRQRGGACLSGRPQEGVEAKPLALTLTGSAAYASSDSVRSARPKMLARNSSAARSASARPSGSPSSGSKVAGLPQPLSAKSREATSRSEVLCIGSWAIDHHSSTNAIPSSPTNSRVALDRPRGRPEGLPLTPLSQRPDPSLSEARSWPECCTDTAFLAGRERRISGGAHSRHLVHCNGSQSRHRERGE